MNRSTLFFTVIATLLIGGLIGLSLQEQEQAPAAVAVDNNSGLRYRLINPEDFTLQYDDFRSALPITVGENFIASDKAFKHETLTINFGLDNAKEYKAFMDQGDSIVYRWTVLEGEAYFDVHGHPNTEGTEIFSRYREGQASTGSGSIVAPYEGQHGWFWLNVSDQPIVIELEVAGFYNEILMVSEY